MNNSFKTRRQFIKLASGLLAVPFCSLSGAGAYGQTKPPLRFLTILDSYGLPTATRNQIWTTSTAGDYALTDANLGTILSPLKAYKDNMLVVSGVNMDSIQRLGGGRTHDNITINTLTGSRSTGGDGASRKIKHASLDVHIGQYLNSTYGLSSPRAYPHLFFTDYAERAKSTFCFDATGTQIRSIAGPKNIANSVFTPGGTGLDEVQYQSRTQVDVLDLVSKQVQSVRGQLANVNKEDVMEAYHTSVNELAAELELRGANACSIPDSINALPDGTTRVAVNTTPHVFNNIYQAFACDLVSSLSYSIGGETINQLTHAALYNAAEHSDLAVRDLLRKNLHAASHRTDDVANKVHEIVRIYQAELLADLLDKMNSTPDVNGDTLLDNTVIFWASAMSNNTHQITDYPYLLIAGKNAQLQGGFHYDCSDSTNNDLLTTIAQGLTLPDDNFGGHNLAGNYLSVLNNGPITKLLKG